VKPCHSQNKKRKNIMMLRKSLLNERNQYIQIFVLDIKIEGTERDKNVLELIYTNICGPFPTTSWNGKQYFITFIDDYSRYDYLYLIHKKSQSLHVLKSFKAEVEFQLRKKIKVVKSDCGGEYYGRYDGSREQHPGPFSIFLKECEIVLQYTMSGKPSMNSVVERRNRTLKDIMRKALKTSIYILNRVSLKQLTKPLMNFGLDCLAEARPYRLHERKLDSRTISYYFVGYTDPSWDPFFETGNARILEEDEFGKEENIRNVDFEEEFANDIGQVLVPITVQATTSVIEDNVQIIVPDIVPKQDYDEVLPQIPIEKPQQP
ncbi:hypothetical protein CR513_32480, partial [Mucuna pruriens]